MSTDTSVPSTTLDVESESDASVSDDDGVVEAALVSHGGASSICSSSSSAAGETTPIVCDIGKLQDSRVDIRGLSRDNKY